MENQDDFIPFDQDSVHSDDSQEAAPQRELQSVDILTPLPIPPWVPSNFDYPADLVELLNEEINDYIKYIKPTEVEHKLRLLTLQRLKDVVTSIFPKAQMKVFGSFETKLYLPSSDLDVVVIDPSLRPPNCLHKLKRALEDANVTSRIEGILIR
jgi:DNA polymerase sigma